MYKCEICKTTTSVQCWKPKIVNKQDDHKSDVPKLEEQETTKPKKVKGKRKKTAGLVVPPLKKSPAVAKQQSSLSMAKLSSMFQHVSSLKSATTKLNDFLK